MVFGPVAAVFSGLLVVTGIAKIRRPGETSRALALLGLPDHKYVGLSLGVLEFLLGLIAIVTSAPEALLAQGFLYTGFLAWIGWAMARDQPISSCGCLGTPDTPPYLGHLVVDGLAVIASAGAAIGSADWLPPEILPILVTGLVVGVGILLCLIVIGDGARLYGARSR